MIGAPAAKVFVFVTDPANTPKWIDFISQEKTNEWPPRLGTIYKNQNEAGEWRELEITEYVKNRMFVMSDHGSGYNVKYTLSAAGPNTTELEYYEWMDSGELDQPFTQEPLKKLKSILGA